MLPLDESTKAGNFSVYSRPGKANWH